ncbi:hypothetical protein [Rubinisphaera italica]|uniref:hypothetical protein n=1 Tax=Rubinisphaera italica TaxID=2527969 RepID=UPI0013EEFDBF|nr:hypothetical protein [Rubinisphaera italica]
MTADSTVSRTSLCISYLDCEYGSQDFFRDHWSPQQTSSFAGTHTEFGRWVARKRLLHK